MNHPKAEISPAGQSDLRHHLHPYTQLRQLEQDGPLVIVRGEGVQVFDEHGKAYIEGMAGLWCASLGFSEKRLAEAAYKQMLDLPYYNTFFKTTTVPTTELAAKISSVMPERFKHIFFTNSGSESNDTIVRFVRHYWKLKGKPYRQHFIARTRGYHGSTMVAANLGGFQGMHDQVGTEFPGFHHIQQPHWFDFGGDKTPEEYGLEAAAALETKILEVGPDNVAAFIGEPIQGAGGVLIPPSTYWPEVQRICRKYGILIISDEVICGFGRTGNWWGFETMGFEPDIVPMAKGLSSGYLPIGAVAFADHLVKDFFELGGEFYHGMTYAGHPVACAVALKNIEIIEQEKLVEHTREIGPYFAEALASLRDHPIVGETRSMGLIGAIELSNDKAKRSRFASPGRVGTMCRDNCFKNGLIMRACWDTMVLAPPLVITRKEIDELVRLARLALDATYAQVKSEVV